MLIQKEQKRLVFFKDIKTKPKNIFCKNLDSVSSLFWELSSPSVFVIKEEEEVFKKLCVF